MNRQRYQLVFNRHRGMLMAVAETASAISGQKLPTARGGASVVAPASWKFCTLVLVLALTWQSVAHAQILVDRNAPREEQPMVLKAANGVPVVNIRQPNAKGLSVNSYRRFDVDGRGVILNNAGNSSKSELGGYIAGNPWMPGGGAQVIVNQVNATDPSYLRGFIEVAGNPAQVIIANPAGITCAGCGFINAQRATMTTGTPVIRQGNLESYRVNSGVISFEGLGLQANDTAYADVIARAVRVHAALRARQIRLTTGLNTVSADHAQVTPGQSATDGAPVRAIDVAALGGMYAGHIYLSATEHGVGVHNGGTLTATEGQLVVTAAGRLENTGTLAAHGDTRIAAAGAVTNSGVIGSDSTLQINADALENTARGRIGSVSGTSVQIGGTLRNTGSIVGDAGITLAAAAMENAGSVVTPDALALRIRNMLDNSGKLFSHGSLLMRIGAAALNSGKIGADGAVDFRASSLANGGGLYSLNKSVDVQTRESITNSGTVEAKQSVSLKAATLNNSGTFTAEGAMKLSLQQGLSNTGEIGANDTLTVNAATLENRGRVRSAESSLELTTDVKTSNQGKILAANRLEITANGIDNSDGALGGGEVVIDARNRRFNNQRGVLFARQDLKLDSADLYNSRGSIAALGKLRLSSGAINNERGQLQSKGAMQVEVSAGDIDNRRGLIRSDEDVTLQSQSLRNDDTQGKDQGIEGRSVSLVTGALHNNNGAIRTGQSLQIAARERVDNRGGLLSSQGTLSVSDPASTRRLVIDNEGGRILAGGDLSLTSDSLIGKGLLLSHKDLRIDVTADLEQRGETAAAGNLDLRIGGRFSNYGTLAAGAALRVTARGLQNHAGASILGGDVSLSAGAGQDFINRGLIDGVTTRIQAGTLYNLGTGRIYGDRIALAADVLHNASESVDGMLRAPVIAARERLDIGTGLLYNSEQALLYSVGDMSIGGAIGSDHRATGRAREVNNTSATVNADGALTIAADAINNRNAHVEIAEESKPGRRIINYRLVGSPDFVSGDNARLIHQDSGQIIAPENWRAMGDEDNFRLLLPSEEYPFDRYGPPFDYSRHVGRGGRLYRSFGVGPAYLAAIPEVSTEHSTFPAEPERFVYQPGDRIWDVFRVARPTTEVPPEPELPRICSDPESCPDADYRQRHSQWKAIRDTTVESYHNLDKAIDRFNRSLYARMVGEWIIYDGTEQIRRTIVTRSAPGMITSGGGMTLAAGVVNNYASQFISGGVLAGDGVNGTAINNIGPMGQQTVTSIGTAEKTFIKSHTLKADDRRYESAPYASQTIETRFPLDVSATHEAGITRDRTARTVAAIPAQAPQGTGKTADLRAPAVDVSLPANALYQVNQGSVALPLVQTDPRFIGQRNWLSSDFLVRAYQDRFGPAPGYQRFGDGFYEQQLIQRQIQEATGQRYLNGFSNNEAQYLALMQAGLQQAQVQRYALGIALSEAQIAQLKTDIVWLVQRTVRLADGSAQEVLVPQVYLQPSSLRVSGRQTLIAGNEVAFQTVQDIFNRGGTIAARTGVTLRADNIGNLGGRIEGGSVRLLAQSDIDNAGGLINATDKLVLSAGRDIVIRSTSVKTANATTTGSNIDQVASVSGKDMVLLAGRDLQADAAVIAASGDTTLSAGRDVRLGVVQEYFRQEIRWADDKGGSNRVSLLTGPNFVDRANGAHGTSEVGINRAVVTGSKEVATQVSGNSIRIQSGQDVASKGAQVVAEGALQVEAGRDVRIGTANVTASARDQGQRSSSGILTSTTVRTDDASSTSREMGSTFSGDTVLLRAGRDVNVSGSSVVSTQGTAVAAGNDVNIVAASESSSQRNFRQETKSGVMGAGIGVTVGSRMQSRDVDRNSETASASTIGSVQGDVRIVAGNRYMQVGSDVLAPGGDIDIVARTVSILAAQQSSRTVTEDKFRQQGVTVAVTSPVLSAVQTVQQMAEAASKTKSGRAQALAAATAGMSIYSALGEMQKGAAEGSANVGISATIGSSQSSSRTEQNTVMQRSSTVASGGNMSISAKGDGANSNITIAGSDINVKGNLALKADNDINLIAAQNTDEQHSERSSSSWGVGVTAQFGTKPQFGFTANAAGSRGNSDGKDVSNVTTRVRAGGQAKLESGRDTNLIGAAVSAEQVSANVGRDLNIASVQDTSTFKSRDQSIGGSATIGPSSGGSISASRSRVDADYASVGQQAGITAGDGGFQINVKGNTDLKGAQIASTDKAVEQGKNSLTTGTITSSDIQNRSQYSAQSQSASAGTSQGKPGGGIGIGNASGSETSVTHSGVSGAAVTIADAQAQQAKTGQSPDQAVASLDTSVRTGKDSSNSLAKNWNGNQLREDVEAQAKITQAFGQQASKLIGDYAEQQQKKAEDLRKQANAATDPAVAAQLNDQASALDTKWGPDGNMRALAHTVVGGLTGGLAGAAGAGAGTLAAPNVAAALNKAGVDADLAKVLTGLSSTLVGAAVGGTAGGAAAYNEVINNFLGHIDRERLNKLRQKAQSKGVLTKDEAEQLVFLEVSDQISDGLLNKYRSGQQLTKFEQQNLVIYLGGYAQQNGREATQQLIQNGSAPSYTFPYAGSSSDRSDHTIKNFKWLDYFYRDPGTNESIFNDARAKAGTYPNVTPYETLTPVGMQWSRFFSVVDSIANSSLATGTYLGATLARASADTKYGLTIAMGQLAQIGASFVLPKAGISPVFGKASADVENARTEPKIFKLDEEIESLRNIAGKSNGPDLTGKQPGTILVQQQLKRFDELADLFSRSVSNNTIIINGTKIEATPPGTVGGSNLSGSTKVLDSQPLTDQQIFGYAQQLAGNSSLVQKASGVWVADIGGGQTITLRSISSSQGATGARWTIDLRGSPQLQNINSSIKQFELKFR